jgi:hypothetical protein
MDEKTCLRVASCRPGTANGLKLELPEEESSGNAYEKDDGISTEVGSELLSYPLYGNGYGLVV